VNSCGENTFYENTKELRKTSEFKDQSAHPIKALFIVEVPLFLITSSDRNSLDVPKNIKHGMVQEVIHPFISPSLTPSLPSLLLSSLFFQLHLLYTYNVEDTPLSNGESTA
jgi:hypothetical protein